MTTRLRVMTARDIPEGMRLKDLAGWNQTAVDWERFLTASPEGCFAAEHDGRVIGTSTTIVYEARFAWIGMVLVEERYRGRGIGKALLNRAISHLDSQNVPCMKLDATPQGKILYEKLGFKPEYEIERWMLKRQPERKKAKGVPVDIDDVLDLDREIFGADRGRLLRSISEQAPEFTLVARQNTHVAGYTFGRRGSLADHMGPWVASEKIVAANLLDQFLNISQRKLVFVDCLSGNPWAVPLVEARGFEFSRPLTRMFRGTNTHAGRLDLLCAGVGPEFG